MATILTRTLSAGDGESPLSPDKSRTDAGIGQTRSPLLTLLTVACPIYALPTTPDCTGSNGKGQLILAMKLMLANDLKELIAWLWANPRSPLRHLSPRLLPRRSAKQAGHA